jgi:hypothetical protein
MTKRIIAILLAAMLLTSVFTACGKAQAATETSTPTVTIYNEDTQMFEDALLPFGMSDTDACAAMGEDYNDEFSSYDTYSRQFEQVRLLYDTEVLTSVTFTNGVVTAVQYTPVTKPEDTTALVQAAIDWNKLLLDRFGDEGYQTNKIGDWATPDDAGDIISTTPTSAWTRGEEGSGTFLRLQLQPMGSEKTYYTVYISEY